MHAHFGFRMQITEEELENNIPENYAQFAQILHIAKAYTHSIQKSHQECSKQLTTGNRSSLLNKYSRSG